MRSTQTCPKCSCHKFAVTAEFRQGGYRSGEQSWSVPFHAIAVTIDMVSTGETSTDGATKAGHFETWICVACGYTEFYAKGLPRDLESLAKRYPDQLHIVDAGPPEKGPYR